MKQGAKKLHIVLACFTLSGWVATAAAVVAFVRCGVWAFVLALASLFAFFSFRTALFLKKKLAKYTGEQ